MEEETEVYLTFEKPYEGVEKISETEYVLHNYRGNIYIPFRTKIIVIDGNKKNIHDIRIESLTKYVVMDMVRSITGTYFTMENYVIHNGDTVRIITEEKLSNPVFYIINDAKNYVFKSERNDER